MKPIEILSEYLKGKGITHINIHGRTVTLVVESVVVFYHHIQLTPETPQNDWWGDSKDWETIKVIFEDGSSIDVRLEDSLDVKDLLNDDDEGKVF